MLPGATVTDPNPLEYLIRTVPDNPDIRFPACGHFVHGNGMRAMSHHIAADMRSDGACTAGDKEFAIGETSSISPPLNYSQCQIISKALI
jgi:hypothetical protein